MPALTSPYDIGPFRRSFHVFSNGVFVGFQHTQSPEPLWMNEATIDRVLLIYAGYLTQRQITDMADAKTYFTWLGSHIQPKAYDRK